MPVLIYTVQRILLVVGAGALLWVVDFRGWLMVPVAVLIGAGLSYVLLDGPRRRAAAALERRAGGRRTRFEESLARESDAEDAEVDALERRRGPRATDAADRGEPRSADGEGEAEHRAER